MLPIKPSNTKQSSIVEMGKRLSQASKATGKEYLLLNRGVNSVININLDPIIKTIDFNSPLVQNYPASEGHYLLREAINTAYFNNLAETKNILITGGGISGLDICFQNLAIDKILIPKYFWGTYTQLLNLRNIDYADYESYEWLIKNANQLKNKAIIICDPGNPLGEKFDDNDLIQVIEELNKNGAIILFDSPYRRLFYDNSDTFYQKLLAYDRVIIIESFSKSLGLSGQRIGFIHCNDKAFTKEASLRLYYATNGINGFAQAIVCELLTSTIGQREVSIFKQTTCASIKQNIDYLIQNKLLASELYKNTLCLGIFACINKSQEELFQKRIGSVSLSYFTLRQENFHKNISRILVSIPHEKFVSFFRTIQ